jgi:hypothetical protein
MIKLPKIRIYFLNADIFLHFLFFKIFYRRVICIDIVNLTILQIFT